MRSIFLAVTISTAYAHLSGWPAGLHPVLRACFAVLVLVLGVGLWRKRERPACSLARAIRAPRWPDYLAVGMGVLAIECLFLFFLSATPPLATQLAERVEASVLPARAAARLPAAASAADTPENIISGNWLWDDQGQRRLPLTTNARPSNKPEIFFRPADQETAGQLLTSRPYIRAFAMEHFEDSTWSAVAIEAESLEADGDGWVILPPLPARPGPVLRGEVFHPSHPGGQDVFTAPQGATRARLPELRRVAAGVYRLNPLRDPSRGYNYEVESKTITLSSLLESGALDAFLLPDAPAEHLVALPEQEDLRQALIDIAIKTQGPIESRLLSIRKILQKQYEYSLQVDNPEKLDPILNFLVHEKRGHCEFFATAGALLCRALDIPARVAYGWSGGRYFASQNLFMFRAREAHAWTEVYLKDIGWVVLDSTPPGALDAANSSLAPPDENPPLDDDGQFNFNLPGSGGGPPNLWIFVALGLGLGLLALAFLVLRFRKRPPSQSELASATLIPDPPGYLERFRAACARLGHPMPTGSTLRQQLAALARQDHRPAFADDLLEYHYAITYGNARRNRSRESRLLKAVQRWR